MITGSYVKSKSELKKLLWNVIFAVAFEVRAFFELVRVLIQWDLFYFAKTHICWRIALATIAHGTI